jgi:ABC-type branched-subunit amino acid transport system substrate-binding protein
VTDANVMTGRINADFFPRVFGHDGRQPIDPDIVARKFSDLARDLSTSPEEAADGFLKIAVANMAEAIKRNKGNADPLRVAYTLEGMRFTGVMGDIEMRASDHQLQQPLFISSWAKVGGPLRHDVEKTGFTWKTERAIDTFVAATPTSCAMQRPAKP